MNTPKPVSADRRNAQLHPNFAWLNSLCCSPTPWRLDAPYPDMANRIVDADGFDVVDLGPGPYSHANAALIVRACNSHDDLVAALTAAEIYLQGNRTGRRFEESDVVGLVQKALAKAKGESRAL